MDINHIETAERIASLLDCKTEGEFLGSLGDISKKFGFETFVAGAQVTSKDGSAAHHTISGYPAEWQRIYAERNYVGIDPTVAHCLKSPEPLIWTQNIFENGMSMWEEAKGFGLSYGISIATHDISGVKSMLSLVRDKPILESEARHISAMTKVLSSCAHFATAKIANQFIRNPENSPKLTHQETECLKWISRGKTSWEVSRIMNVSEPTVNFHVKNSITKLDANNRPQALAIAVRLGLIS
jgi:DNA-binding CsgD family transcriptional regulator